VLDPAMLAQMCAPDAPPRLSGNGAGLPAVLACLRREDGARWEHYLAEVRRLLPEIADVTAGVTVNGYLAFSVTRHGGLALRPEDLSQGTLVILALLALAHAGDRPTLLCFEELERGIHPRLLRDVRDILYRLSFPQDWGEAAPPVQVLCTTHSPYVLDLFVDTPEDVIIAARDDAGAAYFRRMDEIPELREMLESGRPGDLWYSGILGGVP
jgi:predicted ATPase